MTRFLRSGWAFAALAGIVAILVLWVADAPLAGATNDTDSAASVLYFQRLVDGQRLEAFVPTTPKPLLTVVYGTAWAITHDWRALTILALLAAAVAVACAARIGEILGGRVAGVMLGVSLLAWPDFRLEVARGNSFVWAVAFCLLAGVLLARREPRPWAAGVALLLAGLTRPESWWLIAAAAIAFVARALARRFGRELGDPRSVVPLLLGGLAIPLACLHDWLLTGLPLYWLSVPEGYTALMYPHLAKLGLRAAATVIWNRYEGTVLILALAVVGVVMIARARRLGIALALVAAAAGVIITIVVLERRGISSSDRYYEGFDLPVLVAAAVGAAALMQGAVAFGARAIASSGQARAYPPLARAGVFGGRSWRSVASRPVASRAVASLAPGARAASWAAVAAVLGIVLAVPPSAGPPPEQQLATAREADVALGRAIASLPAALAGRAGTTMVVDGVAYPVADPGSSRVFVPRSLLPRIAAETGATLPELGDSYLAFRSGGPAVAYRPGRWILHIAATDGRGGAQAPLEATAPSVVTGVDGTLVRLVPVLVDPEAGVWLIRVDAVG